MTEENTEGPEELDEYRQSLVLAEQKSQDAFDKAVLSLSGGALGVSFIFIKDIVGPDTLVSPCWLLSAWILWAASSLAVLASFYTSHLALQCAIRQCDDGSIRTAPVGGIYTTVTRWLNASGAIMFVLGVLCISLFVSNNLSRRVSDGRQQTTYFSPAEAATAATATASARSPDRRQTEQGLRAAPTASPQEVVIRVQVEAVTPIMGVTAEEVKKPPDPVED